MGSIRILEDALVDQIAAGEVVERPASVVKELVENALDAEASRIDVELVDGGRERIAITDDGVGMSAEDAQLAIRRHATSKVRAFEDLIHLQSLGFRGEALPSIASVSRFRLVTRPREELAGTEVRVDGGKLLHVRDAGCPPGTRIEIDELFYNVPARRKFLKARQTESKHAADICLRVALAHPALHLTLSNDGRVSREYLPTSDRFSRAQRVFSDLRLHQLAGRHDAIDVLAALASPELARTGPRSLYLFVNGRPVQDRKLARAVAQAFGDAIEPGKYPRGVVFVELPADQVDVNAHPQKTEVRFAQERGVMDAVLRVLAEAWGTRRWHGGLRGSAAEVSAGPSLAPPKESMVAPAPAVGERRADYVPARPGFWDQRLGGGGPEAASPRSAPTTTSLFDDARAPLPRPEAAPRTSGFNEILRSPQGPNTSTETPSGEMPSGETPRGGSPSGPAPRPGVTIPATPTAMSAASSPEGPVTPSASEAPAATEGGAGCPAPRPVVLSRPKPATPERPPLAHLRDDGLIIAEIGDELFVLHPPRVLRALVERLVAAALASETALPSQRLLFPTRVEVTGDVPARLQAADARLRQLGFEHHHLGAQTVALDAVMDLPSALGVPFKVDAARAFAAVLAGEIDAPPDLGDALDWPQRASAGAVRGLVDALAQSSTRDLDGAMSVDLSGLSEG